MRGNISSNTLLLTNLGNGAGEIHDDVAKILKLRSNHWLGIVIGHHLLSWAVLDGRVSSGNVISDEVVSNLNMSSLLATGPSSILCQ